MEKEIVAGALFILTFVSPVPQDNLNSQKKTDEVKTYTVLAGDTLSSIAKKEYGSEDFWTTLWNDNDWIKNENVVEKLSKLSIRNVKPSKPEELKKELTDRLNKQPYLVYNYSANNSSSEYSSPESLNDNQINFLGNCESGMTAGRNSGNGFYGAFQFNPGTWTNMGTGYDRADLAPLEVQKDAVQRLLQKSSIYSQFPGCSSQMRNSGLL